MTKTRSLSAWFVLPIAVGGALAVSALAGGCNALTGAGDLAIDDDYGKHDDDETTSGNGQGPTGGDPTSGGTTGGGAGTTGGTSTGQPPMELGAAPGVSISEISMYQVLKRPLMQGGQAASSNIPLVAGRAALIRVFVGTDGNYDGSPVTARLHVGDAAPIEVTKSVGGSTEQSLDSTLNFDVPAELVTTSMSYRVEIGRAGGASGPLSYPASGLEGVPAQSVGSTLKVKLIPVAYGADGSNRLPDTSPGQVKLYQDRFYAMYPIPNVEISVHAAVQWNSGISPNGGGWDSLLSGMANLRESDNAPPDVYYYGIFAPASSFGQFCGGGCVAGLGMIGSPGDAYSRVAIGLGFSGAEVTDTAVHEIGHTHGRQHSPCQVSGDPAYPHPGGVIGVWGYDSVQHQLLSPNTADVMGYCFPIWISDWTYSAIFTRIKQVNGAQIIVPPELQDRTYEQISVNDSGELSWLSPIKLRRPPMGEIESITIETADGTETVEGNYFPYDHLQGGVLLVRQPESASIESLTLSMAGKILQLSR